MNLAFKNPVIYWNCACLISDSGAAVMEEEEEIVDIYTKFNIIDRPDGKRTIVISFHKRNKPIDYLFR